MEAGGVHVTSLQSVEMGSSSSESLQLLNNLSIIKFTITFIMKACLLSASSAVLSRGSPPSADPRGCLERPGGWISKVAEAAWCEPLSPPSNTGFQVLDTGTPLDQLKVGFLYSWSAGFKNGFKSAKEASEKVLNMIYK